MDKLKAIICAIKGHEWEAKLEYKEPKSFYADNKEIFKTPGIYFHKIRCKRCKEKLEIVIPPLRQIN